MKNVLFIFASQKSLEESQNVLRDIMYYGYDLRIEYLLEKDANLDEVSKDEKYLLVFTEVNTLVSNKNRWRRLDGLSAKDLIDEINEECLVFN